MSKAIVTLVVVLLSAPVLADVQWPEFIVPGMTAADFPGIGYQERPCGFDLDDDGIIGEPEDCTICNDREGTTQILEDFDNDGAFEVQTYIDAQLGYDSLLCGGPETPCRTVMYAKRNRLLETEGENVMCFRGIGHEALLVGGLHNGQAGVRIVPASGDLPIDWELPANPTMLVGWDFDQDGQYAPWDEDDIADWDGEILLEDGTTSYINVFFRQDCYEREVGKCSQSGNILTTSRWEVAHLRIREYGTLPDANPSRGVFHAERHHTWADPGPEMGGHVYFHDIHADKVNYKGDSRSGNMFFEGWDRSFEEWITVDNINVTNFCGYAWRGGGGAGPKENFLIRNTSIDWYCDDEPADGGVSTPGIKLWGTYDGVYVINNFWDQSPVRWATPGVTRVAGGIMSINTCIRDFYAIGNVWKNSQDYFVIQGGLFRGCQQRNGDNINYIGNLAINDDDRNNFLGVNLSLGRDELVFTEDVSIVNNVWLDLGVVPNLKRAIHVQDDVPANSDLDPSGSYVKILNNTFYSPETNGYSGMFTVGAGHKELGPDKSHNFIVKNNIFAQDAANRNFPNYASQYHPAMGEPMAIVMDMDNNVWENTVHPDQSGSRKLWKSGNGDNDIKTNSLEEFAAATGWGVSSKGAGQDYCKVEFVDRVGGNFRLAEGDTCAKDAGADLSMSLSDDFYGAIRPQGDGWDIGAHEYGEMPPPPSEGACCDGGCSITTQDACGGAWQGAQVACLPDPCPVIPPPVLEPRIAFTARSLIGDLEIVEVCVENWAGELSCSEVKEVTVRIGEPE